MTQETKHTAGPWRTKYGTDYKTKVEAEAGTIAVARIGGEISVAQAEANAHLIAAAPDLLHALAEMCFMATHASLEESEKRRILKKAREAIAKARGEAV